MSSNTRPSNSKSSTNPVPQKIYFYSKHKAYASFSNFSNHPVYFDGKKYPTSEHLFHAFKFMEHRPDLAEHIRTYSDKPRDALFQARQHRSEQRKDWFDVNVEKMDIVLYHKFTQHKALKQELLDTGDAELIEDSNVDSFWGIGANKDGRNELGKALMRLRAQLRQDDSLGTVA
ncbi:DUF1768-domain-containing protein [Dendrothele bispora CBS 962.96]|uniref:DUF1768-domain-containing protein n=1 Tax=Dendrothele bispora (strain CBS 962.96) TaxID=1314807 RepID=A0A4S8MM78_DENBC|nr:DUF1768-domain-containing protein [Dendrothele bispora CBS 962.96]